MRHTATRPAVALLTFSLGVGLGPAFPRGGPGGAPSPPRTPQENRPPAQARVEEQPARAEGRPRPLPERFRKVGDLPEEGAEAARGVGIYFVDENVGWLARGAKLWRTADGGATWGLVYSEGEAGPPDPAYIDKLRFVNPNDGWMLVDGELRRTRDGGRTWLPLRAPAGEAYFFSAVDFLPDGRRGWLAGSVCSALRDGEETANRFYCSGRSASVAAVFMTNDGGRTWDRQPVTRRFGGIGYLRMRDAQSGFAVGQAGAFRYEGGRWLAVGSAGEWDEEAAGADGGRALEIAIGLPTYCPVNFHFIDRKRGWLTNSNGYVARTGDGGRTWVDLARCAGEGPHLDPPYFFTLRIGGDGRGVALDTDGALQETADGGVTWERVTGRDAFAAMFVLDADSVWLVAGDGIYKDGGRAGKR